jgi:hypothetical protein
MVDLCGEESTSTGRLFILAGENEAFALVHASFRAGIILG